MDILEGVRTAGLAVSCACLLSGGGAADTEPDSNVIFAGANKAPGVITVVATRWQGAQ